MTDGNNETKDKKIHTSPTKDFFIKMITRDIALEDCIFDLLDNAIDGARRQAGAKGGDEPLKGFWAKISSIATSFRYRTTAAAYGLATLSIMPFISEGDPTVLPTSKAE